ncbi:hypothetical protein H0W91_00660 [Patescibacteria group bacterium]|nr:hypothetical protein [Patescibacteria group bacterium]
MTTIINPGTNDNNGGAGMVIGVIIALVLIALFFVFALPAIRKGNSGSANINVTLPAGTTGGSSAQ